MMVSFFEFFILVTLSHLLSLHPLTLFGNDQSKPFNLDKKNHLYAR